MRSMALASAPVCYLLLVLKLANCSLLVLLVAENWLHGLRFVWVRATHILNAKWCVSYLGPCREVNSYCHCEKASLESAEARPPL